jgi:hypothetical protein
MPNQETKTKKTKKKPICTNFLGKKGVRKPDPRTPSSTPVSKKAITENICTENSKSSNFLKPAPSSPPNYIYKGEGGKPAPTSSSFMNSKKHLVCWAIFSITKITFYCVSMHNCFGRYTHDTKTFNMYKSG